MDTAYSPATGQYLTRREHIVDEVARQYALLADHPWRRNMLLSCAYVFCAVFGHPPLMLVLALLDIGMEMLSLRLMRGLDPVASPLRYSACLALVVGMACTVSAAAGSTWMVDDPYAKALAVGLGIITLLQLSTVRSIHLPFAIVGMTTVSAVMIVINTAHWIEKGSLVGLAFSTIVALTAITYAVLAMLSNHALHEANAATLAKARASDAAKSFFLAQMSHELRTPLNAIIGLGEIEATSATGVSRERLQTLVTAARGLAGVLDDVLDLSAINTGQLSVVARETNLRSVISATLAIGLPATSTCSDSFSVCVGSEVPEHVFLDAQRLRQCLTNLISNAIKHAACKGIFVSVTYQRDRLTIEVADNGPGVPREVARTLFEPFRRGDGQRPGLGLGLAISRSLARRMGGDIVLVPSEIGATFRLTVEAPACSPPPQAKTLDLTGQRILVVDDIATNRMVASGLLRALGATVLEAPSGGEALVLLEQMDVDLVLLDMAMPDLNGFETFHRLRAGRAGLVPVIAMTAGAMPEQRREIELAGMNGFLAKPILPEAIGPALGPHLRPGWN